MAAGESLTGADRREIDATIRRAEQLSRCEFSVFVGQAGRDPRAYATSLHNSLVAPARTVLLLVDPRARVIEVVTGADARARLTDAEVASVVDRMTTDLASGDLVGGLTHGIDLLAQAARE